MPAEPLGVSLLPDGVQVAIPAPFAESVFFCIFDVEDREVARHRLPHRQGDVHHGHLPGIGAGTRYALRADGPRALRFNPAKALIDPWARALDRVPRLHATQFDTAEAPDASDSGPFVPKALVTPALPPLPTRGRPDGPQVIYELHVRGFTVRHPEVPEGIRGTFAGLAHPAAVAHLKALGVTMVELMPAAGWIDERHLPPLGLTNYWGYNPVALLAPDPRLAPGGMAEVRRAVAALQAEGIAVVLDVVLNHTGEGDHLGPTLSLKGLGDAAWYRLAGGGPKRYVDDSGCGNTLAVADRPWPMRLAMDALRHWAEGAGLDGFRLDLAATLGRRESGFDPDAPLLLAMRQDPVLRERLIIAEPWDIGAGGYQFGRFAPGWGEWNDRFRDTVRRFWRGDAGMVGDLATRLAGSAEGLGPHRPVSDSVNYITAHDGFTLADLVAYTAKRNEANGEENRDGTEGNHSWNCGIEGPTEDAGVLARRAADARALLATLLTARGTPMLSMGDECGRSQGGNNNAYAQDTPLSWFDWEGRDEALQRFAARLVRARLAHPALHAPLSLTGGPTDASGLADVAWLRPDGQRFSQADWTDAGTRCLVALLHAQGDRCVVALNGGGATTLSVPQSRRGHRWQVLASSAEPEREECVEATTPLAARSVLILAEMRPGVRPGQPDPALLEALAGAAGIATTWHGITGGLTQVPEGTVRALLGALGLPAESAAQARDSLARLSAPPALPPSVTVRVDGPRVIEVGAEAPPLLVRLTTGEEVPVASPREAVRVPMPDGRERLVHRVALPPLPTGRHMLSAGAQTCHLAIVPPACWLPPDLDGGKPRFGIGAQTYALRHAADQGIGDFTAVAELARAAAASGALYVGISPPHALTPTDRERASPYYPSDRRFLDPILTDVAALHDMPGVRAALQEAEPVFAALRARDHVDYTAVWAAKRRVLEAAWAQFPREDAGFAAFRREGGAAIERFCAWNRLAEREGHTDARRWAEPFRRGDTPALAAFLREDAEGIGFIAFQQYLADAQLGRAARAGAGLYRDLAVGAAPDGAEVWSGSMAFLSGFVVGAPPDPFAAEGQVWGLPAPDPRALAETGHAGFAALVRANMRHAAALRMDHVLGLRRLFLVPEGARGAEGAYLAYPFDALLGQLALESHAAHCLMVGEDLGTVPEGMGEALQAAKVLSYRVLWFEREGDRFRAPDHYPPRAAACVSTHDLPPLEGWWAGEDVMERARLGLVPDEVAELARRAAEREALLDALEEERLLPPDAHADGPMTDALAAAIHAYIARTPCLLALVQSEDLAGERIGVNLPGTDWERPNWRRRLPVAAAGLLGTPRARAILRTVGGQDAAT